MASFNQTFDFANWDQAKFDSYRNVEDERTDEVARFIIDSPHYTQVYEALSKVVYNNEVISIKLFADIIQDRAARANVAITTGMAGAHAPAAPTDTAVADPHDHNGMTEDQFHNDDQCLTDEDHEELVERLNSYFGDLSLFDFVQSDPQTLATGSDIFNFYYVHSVFARGVRSLMKQYAAFNATQVLKFTKLIYDMPYRRIMETVQFVMDVMDPMGFAPEGCAIRSIQKLRLVHAMIRVRIHEKLYDKNKKDSDPLLGDWKTDEWGKPINQQDMIFAVHTFSIEMIDAMLEIGEFNLKNDTDRRNIEAFYMMWHHIGRALGTVDEINPLNYTDGKKLQEIIYKKQFIANPNNADILVPPLVGFLEKLLSVKGNRKVYSLVRYYNRSPEDRVIFKNILGIDLKKDSDKRFYFFIYISFLFLRIFFSVVLVFINKKKQKEIARDFLLLNYKLLGKIIYVASDGQYAMNKHFRVADGFGLPEPVIDYKDLENQPTFFSSLIKMLFLKLWGKIKDAITNLYNKIFNKKS